MDSGSNRSQESLKVGTSSKSVTTEPVGRSSPMKARLEEWVCNVYTPQGLKAHALFTNVGPPACKQSHGKEAHVTGQLGVATQPSRSTTNVHI